MTNALRENREQTADFLQMLFHSLDEDEQIEIRYRHASGNGHMHREFANSPRHAYRFICKLPLLRCDIYCGVAPRKDNIGTKEGIDRIQCLWADLDAKGEHTRQSRWEQITNLAFQPSMVLWSGHGFHVYWKLRKYESGRDALLRAEQAMGRIARALDGDAVQDCSRILRVAGTYNYKEADDPKSVQVVRLDYSKEYSLQELSEWSRELCGECETDTPVDPITRSVSKDVLKSPLREGNRNVSLTSVAGSLRSRGLDKEVILMTLLNLNEYCCSPPLPESEVARIAQSVCKYDAGTPKYRDSSARRVFGKGGS